MYTIMLRKRKKAAILQRINKANFLKVQDMNSLIQTVDITYITNTEGNITGPVTIGKILDEDNELFSPSKHICDFIKKESVSKSQQEEMETEFKDSCAQDKNSSAIDTDIPSTLPDDVIEILNDNLDNEIEKNQSGTQERTQHNTVRISDLDEVNLNLLFQDSDEIATEVKREEQEHMYREQYESTVDSEPSS